MQSTSSSSSRGVEPNNPMKVFVILVILAILFFVFASSSLANVDLTPYSPPDTTTNFSTPNLTTDVFNEPDIVVIQSGSGTGQTTAPNVVPVTGSCSDPYVVQPGDILSGIAAFCNTTVAAIRTANPSITNANLIYPGQQLRIPGASAAAAQPGTLPTTNTVPVPVTGATPAPGTELLVSPTPAEQSAAPALSPLPVIQAGVGLRIRAINYPPNTPITIGIGPQAGVQNIIATGMTDASGMLVMETVVPAAPDSVTPWIVVVRTTVLPDVQAASQPFFIDSIQ